MILAFSYTSLAMKLMGTAFLNHDNLALFGIVQQKITWDIGRPRSIGGYNNINHRITIVFLISPNWSIRELARLSRLGIEADAAQFPDHF